MAFAATGLVAWSKVKQRVTISLSEGSAAATGASEQMALLQEDLRSVREDLSALAKHLGMGMQAMQEALDTAAAEGAEATRAAVADSVRGLSSQAGESNALARSTLERLAAVEGRIQELERSLAGPPEQALAAAPPESSAPSVAAAVPVAEPVQAPAIPAIEVPPPVASVPPAPEPELANAALPAAASSTTAAPPVGPKPTRGFLAFQLPSQSLAFGERARFEVITSLSRVGFDAQSTLHDFSGSSAEVRGQWTACLERPEEGVSGSVSIRSRSLDTKNADRDQEMFERLAAGTQSSIEFSLERFEASPGGIDAQRQTLQGTVHGQMTIKGRSRPLEMPVRIRVDESRRLVVEGEAKLALSRFGVEAPSKLGVISMRDEVRIWIALRARCLGRAEDQASAERGQGETAVAR